MTHLEALLADPSLRQRMGAAGRALVEERYSVQSGLPQLLDALFNNDAP